MAKTKGQIGKFVKKMAKSGAMGASVGARLSRKAKELARQRRLVRLQKLTDPSSVARESERGRKAKKLPNLKTSIKLKALKGLRKPPKARPKLRKRPKMRYAGKG